MANAFAKKADEYVKSELERHIPQIELVEWDGDIDYLCMVKNAPLLIHVQRALRGTWNYPRDIVPWTKINAITVEMRTAKAFRNALQNKIPGVFIKLDYHLEGWLCFDSLILDKRWRQRGIFEYPPRNNKNHEIEEFVGVYPKDVITGKWNVINYVKGIVE